MNLMLKSLRCLLLAGACCGCAGPVFAQGGLPAPSRPDPGRIGVLVHDAPSGGVKITSGTRLVYVQEYRRGEWRERPAYLLRGDTIDGVSVADRDDLLRELRGRYAGESITISGYDASTGGRERYTARLLLQ